jgi:hypothetical protein
MTSRNVKKFLLWTLPVWMSGVCHAEDITIRFNGSTATVEQKVKDSVSVTVEGAHVNIESTYQEHKLTLLVKGKSEDGQLILKTAGKTKVKLDGLNLTSQEGAPLWLKNKKKVEIVAKEGTKNSLTITACNDTANHKAATIWAKDKILLSGKGSLDVIATGDGCRGIKSKDDITIEDLTLNVTTSGNHLGEKPFGMGGFGGPPMGGMPPFNFDDMPEDVKKMFEERRKEMEDRMKNGEFPMGGFGGPFGGMRPEGNDSTRRGGFPPFGGMRPERNDSTQNGFPPFGGGFPGNRDENGEEGEGMGFGGKHKYVASTKGIASKGKVIINSGNVTVRTNTAGAEGIEGKEGVVLNGGNVDVLSTDDAINANAVIEFNGANVIARSKGNDAVDANPQSGFFSPFGSNEQSNEPAIVIRGGTVYAWSQVGSPEEGLDCDFAALIIEGGTVFSVGGGMGEMPSVPTNETAKQATALLIGLNIAKDEPINIYDSNNKLIESVTVPFSLRRSASLVSSPSFTVGGTYTVKTKDYEKTFTLNEKFSVIR